MWLGFLNGLWLAIAALGLLASVYYRQYLLGLTLIFFSTLSNSAALTFIWFVPESQLFLREYYTLSLMVSAGVLVLQTGLFLWTVHKLIVARNQLVMVLVEYEQELERKKDHALYLHYGGRLD